MCGIRQICYVGWIEHLPLHIRNNKCLFKKTFHNKKVICLYCPGVCHWRLLHLQGPVLLEIAARWLMFTGIVEMKSQSPLLKFDTGNTLRDQSGKAGWM